MNTYASFLAICCFGMLIAVAIVLGEVCNLYLKINLYYSFYNDIVYA